MKFLRLSLPVIATLLTASFTLAAEQSGTPPSSPASTDNAATSTEKAKSYSEAAVACSEAADKAGNEDKWDESFQICMKDKGFNNSSTDVPAIPDSESDEENDM